MIRFLFGYQELLQPLVFNLCKIEKAGVDYAWTKWIISESWSKEENYLTVIKSSI